MVYTNLFQNAKILEKNSAAPSRWISPYITLGSKIFLSWDKCRGLNFSFKVIFCAFANKFFSSKNGNYLHVKVVPMYN